MPSFDHQPHRPKKLTRAALATTLLFALGACSEKNYYTENVYVRSPDAEAPPPTPSVEDEAGAPQEAGVDPAPVGDAGSEPSNGDGGAEPPAEEAGVPDRPNMEGAPTPNTSAAELDLDVFGVIGNRYWFATDPKQVEAMNGLHNGPGFPIFNQYGDIYTPGGEGDKTYVDSLFVTTAGPEPLTADFGKIQTRLIGQSTSRPWSPTTLPNLRLNMDGYTDGMRLGGFEHVRFNNNLVGSIFREKLTLDLYRAMGYPAPLATFAWVGSNVWGEDLAIPYTLTEVYKKSLCKRHADDLGGGCVNMWEFAGDLGWGALGSPDTCQTDECDPGRALDLETLLLDTPPGPGFKDDMKDWIAWDEFHQFQCLSWILATGDDALHNQNNVLLVERADGLFQYLPYSVDISLGQDWYPTVELPGHNLVSTGCQNDEACWADTIATCKSMLEEFADLDPIGRLDTMYSDLEAEGMLRGGDEGRYESLRSWFERRLEDMPLELEGYRELPLTCGYPYVMCDGECVLEGECYGGCVPVIWEPGMGEPEPRPINGIAIGVPGPNPLPLPEPEPEPAPELPTDGDAGPNDDGGAIDDGPIDDGPIDDEPPPPCHVIEEYRVGF